MKHFSHIDAKSAKEAAGNLSDGKGMAIAGGTDLLGTLKDEIFPEYPERVVNLKTIEGMDGIVDDGNVIRIGALAHLSDIAESDLVKTHATALAEACSRAASPTIRHMSTLGGNMCQMHRCWYFRCPDDRFHCIRKGGDYCPARIGDNRYHSIYGDQDDCYAVSSHDSAPAIVALNATVKTTKREIAAGDFFHANGHRSNVLADDEIVTEVVVPKCSSSAFEKFALRKSIDFPLVNCAVAQVDKGVRIVLGGVYPAPVRCESAEGIVSGGISESSAEKAGDAAVESCEPLSRNEYKVEIARTLVKRALLKLV